MNTAVEAALIYAFQGIICHARNRGVAVILLLEREVGVAWKSETGDVRFWLDHEAGGNDPLWRWLVRATGGVRP